MDVNQQLYKIHQLNQQAVNVNFNIIHSQHISYKKVLFNQRATYSHWQRWNQIEGV